MNNEYSYMMTSAPAIFHRFGLSAYFCLCLLLLSLGSGVLLANEDEQALQDEAYAEEQAVGDDEDTDAAYDDEAEAIEEEQDVYVEPEPEPYRPINYTPSYSGKDHMRIERGTRPRKIAGLDGDNASADAGKAEQTQATSFFEGECDPVVSVRANGKKRFDVLKDLADEHGFEINMLEAENQPVTMEKNQPLSRVVESITRDMSVVLNYRKINGCERLVAISVLDNAEWSGGGSSVSGAGGNGARTGVRQYKPSFRPISVKVNDDSTSSASSQDYYDPELTPEQNEKRQERLQAIKEEREKRREAEGLRSLNEELPVGQRLNNDFTAKGKFRHERERIDNMEVYVEEVMTGKRVPNVRGMTSQQRIEYMRLRREYNQRQE